MRRSTCLHRVLGRALWTSRAYVLFTEKGPSGAPKAPATRTCPRCYFGLLLD